ncbi:MAG: N-6 DNA methylase [Ignavibacteriae bacterium]|nr:N-6 DNA methylase [Ignavibacteriota bacterium]
MGYTINPDKNYNLTTEFKNETDSKKADGAILQDGNAIGVIELKSTKTVNLESITTQAFNYKNHQNKCRFVITSNFEKLNFYIDNATEWEEFNLFTLTENDFKLFYFLLNSKNILNGIPLKVKEESRLHEENISDKLYKDYSQFKHKIYNNLVKNNPQFDKLSLFKSSQKLLDRILFILFAEDSLLVPPNSITRIVDQWKQLKSLDEAKPLYTRFVKFFNHLNVGHTYEEYSLPAYNGGLFQEDEILDNVKIDDEILLTDIIKLSSYDFSSEVDVNILGHIFEHSLSEIEELTAELEGNLVEREKSKRKKDGIFYTPKYITKYIVDNTIGSLCTEKKKELNLDEIDETILESSRTQKGKLNQKAKILFDNLDKYREYILSLKILDPACGSGAFLNQALEFLIKEHKWIDEHKSSLLKEAFTISEYEKDIVENNIYGVDINEEAVEIAKLSLWLRTAKKGRKLSTLSNNIKCGNSLIDDPKVAGNKAFNWNEEFKEIMSNGGFDVVIGNPPYVFAREKISQSDKDFFNQKYNSAKYQVNTYLLFIEKTIDLIHKNGTYGLIIPNSWLMVFSGEGLRKYIIENCKLNQIINLEGFSFEGIGVETIILIANKQMCFENEFKVFISVNAEFKYSHSKNQKSFLQNEAYEFNVFADEESSKIINKIKHNSFPLDSLLQVKAGLKAYQTGKGKPKQTIEDVKNRPFDYKYKYDNNTFKYLEGKDLLRFCINWSGTYLRFGEHLAEPRKFSGQKIIIREITGKYPHSIIATFTSEEYLFNMSNIAIVERDEKKVELKYVLALLNSFLLSYYFMKNTAKSVRKLFPKIILNDLRLFPIKLISSENQKPFIYKTDKMLLLNIQFQEAVNKFAHRIKDTFILEKISQNLQSFYDYDFRKFRTELKKQKVEISLKQQDEWEEYFNEYKTKINQLQEEITKTDNEIDVMVYKLYNLTYEEVKIVDPQFWMREEEYYR